MKWLTIGKWSLNTLFLLAGVCCLVLAFSVHGDITDNGEGTPVTNKIGTILTGLAFLGLGGYFSWYDWKKAHPKIIPVPVPVPAPEPIPAPTNVQTQDNQPPTEKT